jgi:hypothetical protein
MEKTTMNRRARSERPFTPEGHDHEGIAMALGRVRDTYQVKWCWKYGQQAIDVIKAELEEQSEQRGWR